jgi:metallo-beta-lactamase family protein
MRLTFWGAARTVTGSLHLVELANGRRILLECGLFQGRRALAREINTSFPVEPSSIDAVVLSHAHIDHSGLLPRLWAQGFRGPIYATHATRDLCELMLRDSGYIQEKDAEFFNRKMRKKREPAIEALYTENDAEQVMHQFVGLAYDHPFRVIEGVQAVFRDAGHILGAATVMLEIDEGRGLRLGFTGDVGNPGRPILRDPVPMDPVDWLMSESTYGGRTHPPIADARLKLAEVIKRTAARGGKVVVPAFAVGRTQELVHALDHLWNEGALPPIPVFVDSPLAVDVTGVYRTHPECYDRDLMDYILKDPNPFGFERLEYVRDAQRSKELNGMRVPMVIISASGMAEAGRILHHLRNNVEDPSTTVLIVGFMAEHTLGRKLVERQETVNIFGRPHRLRAEVVVLNTFSAHADEPGMLDFIGRLDRERLRSVFLVHGEPEPQAALTAALNGAGYADVRSPERGTVVELN